MGNTCCSVQQVPEGVSSNKRAPIARPTENETESTDMAGSSNSASRDMPEPYCPNEGMKREMSLNHGQPGTFEMAPKHHCFMLRTPTIEEIGSIRYEHDNIESAKGAGLPIFCVMVELPGDKSSGLDVLSHPLIVEAAETLFESVKIVTEDKFRQSGQWTSSGRRARYTTINFLKENGKDIVTSCGGEVLSVGKVVGCMIRALEECKRNVPMYLQLLHEEANHFDQVSSSGTFKIGERTAVFGCTDCHLGEVHFADTKGVVRTRIGLYHGQRVVEVTYSGLSYASLLRTILDEPAKNVQTVYFTTVDERVAAQMEFSKVPQPPSVVKLADKEAINFSAVQFSKNALRRTELRFVPLTDLQAMRANKLVHEGCFHKATHLLSPRQGVILMKSYSCVSLRSEVVDVPITEAWRALKFTCPPDCSCQE